MLNVICYGTKLDDPGGGAAAAAAAAGVVVVVAGGGGGDDISVFMDLYIISYIYMTSGSHLSPFISTQAPNVRSYFTRAPHSLDRNCSRETPSASLVSARRSNLSLKKSFIS